MEIVRAWCRPAESTIVRTSAGISGGEGPNRTRRRKGRSELRRRWTAGRLHRSVRFEWKVCLAVVQDGLSSHGWKGISPPSVLFRRAARAGLGDGSPYLDFRRPHPTLRERAPVSGGAGPPDPARLWALEGITPT